MVIRMSPSWFLADAPRSGDSPVGGIDGGGGRQEVSAPQRAHFKPESLNAPRSSASVFMPVADQRGEIREMARGDLKDGGPRNAHSSFPSISLRPPRSGRPALAQY